MSNACTGCRDGAAFALPFSMAFQPIFDLGSGAIFAQEALVRGTKGESAYSILSHVDDSSRYAFDQQCRVKAIEMAAARRTPGDGSGLSINFMPNAVYEPRACIRLTLDAARRTGFPLNQIIFEFTEAERLDTDHLLNILRTYREIGFKTAIDDFGAGYAGLDLLARFQPDIVKIDMALIRGIDQERAKQLILKNTLAMLDDLGVVPICEGVETLAELAVIQEFGVRLVQGYVLSKPIFDGDTTSKSESTLAYPPPPALRAVAGQLRA